MRTQLLVLLVHLSAMQKQETHEFGAEARARRPTGQRELAQQPLPAVSATPGLALTHPPSTITYGGCSRSLTSREGREARSKLTELSNVARFSPVLEQSALERTALGLLVRTDPVFANVSAALAATRLAQPELKTMREAARERDKALRQLFTCSGDTGSVDLGSLAANSNHSFALVLASEGRPPELYGHVWGAINAFFCAFVARRARESMRADAQALPPPPTLTVYIGVGTTARSRAHQELVSLFSDADMPDPHRRLVHLRIVRVPWVPTNLGRCYATHAPVPDWAAGRLPLVYGHHPLHRIGAVLPALRPVVHRLIGAPAELHDTILFCSAARGSNQRRIVNEPEVVDRLREWAARAHPQLRFVVQDLQALAYLDELRLFARARVVMSLFGSSLHNCRFMRPGSILVEIKGALRNMVYGAWFYYEICAREDAMRYAAFPASNAAPYAGQADAEAGRDFLNGGDLNAQVDAVELVRFMERVAPAGAHARVNWVRVFRIWERYMEAKPDWNSWRHKVKPEKRLSSWGAHPSSARPRTLVWVRNQTDARGNGVPEYVERLPPQYSQYLGVSSTRFVQNQTAHMPIPKTQITCS